MTDYNTMADIIRESVSAIDTAEALGLEMQEFTTPSNQQMEELRKYADLSR